jgi:hypothetical protein
MYTLLSSSSIYYPCPEFSTRFAHRLSLDKPHARREEAGDKKVTALLDWENMMVGDSELRWSRSRVEAHLEEL